MKYLPCRSASSGLGLPVPKVTFFPLQTELLADRRPSASLHASLTRYSNNSSHVSEQDRDGV